MEEPGEAEGPQGGREHNHQRPAFLLTTDNGHKCFEVVSWSQVKVQAAPAEAGSPGMIRWTQQNGSETRKCWNGVKVKGEHATSVLGKLRKGRHNGVK